MNSLTGTAALETGDPVDFTALRKGRLQRLLDSMTAHQLPALVLSRSDNVSFASGARRLWTAGRKPFAPVAIVVRDEPSVHLMSYSDYLVPPEIPVDRLYPPSLNPDELMERVSEVLQPLRPERIGVDQMSSAFASRFANAFPKAPLVDASHALAGARRPKSRPEIACMQLGAAIAEGALSDVIDAIQPGTTETALLGTFLRRIAGYGSTVMPVQGGFCVQPLESTSAAIPWRLMIGSSALRRGDLVTLSGSLMYDGYSMEVGRTWVCGEPPSPSQAALLRRCQEARGAMLARCRAGVTPDALRRAFESVATLPARPIAYGIGCGMEPPLVSGAVDDRATEPLPPGTTLVLRPYVWERGIGGALIQDTLVLTDDGYRLFTRLPPVPPGTS